MVYGIALFHNFICNTANLFLLPVYFGGQLFVFNDIETEDNRWYANIKFYGNEKGHLYNADMCQFLASLNESRESFESYFTPKDMFDIWKKQKIADYSTLPVTKKVYEDIDNATRMKLRNEHLERQFKKNQSDSE